jgi:hypothetical protein
MAWAALSKVAYTSPHLWHPALVNLHYRPQVSPCAQATSTAPASVARSQVHPPSSTVSSYSQSSAQVANAHSINCQVAPTSSSAATREHPRHSHSTTCVIPFPWHPTMIWIWMVTHLLSTNSLATKESRIVSLIPFQLGIELGLHFHKIL